MAFLDNLLGIDTLNKLRQRADEAARITYDPSIFGPQLSEATELSQEGIADAEIRTNVLQRLFTENPASITGIGSGRELAFLSSLSEQKSKALANVESDISLREEAAKRSGETQRVSILSKMRGIESEREAKILENRIKAEAEASRRRRTFGANLLKFGLTAAGGFLGGEPGALGIGRFLGERLGILDLEEIKNKEDEEE